MRRVTLEEFSSVIAAIHAAAASPDRWSEALSAVERLVKAEDKPGPRDGGSVIETRRGLSPEPSVERLATLLGAHLEAARRIQSKLNETLPAQIALASLNRLSAAALVLDRSGMVHFRNACADTMLNEKDFARIANSRISLRDPAHNKRFFGALRMATQERPRSEVLAFQWRPKGICEIAVSPLTDSSKLVGWVPLALAVVATPHTDVNRIMTRARRLYGLTEAEARVMAALALGASVKQIADIHGVRVSTVRAQVRSIFEKLAVHRQTDLVRIALTGVPIAISDEMRR